MGINSGKYFTTEEAAVYLGVSSDYVRRLIMTGRIKAEKMGNMWVMTRSSFKGFKRTRFSRKKIEQETESTENVGNE